MIILDTIIAMIGAFVFGFAGMLALEIDTGWLPIFMSAMCFTCSLILCGYEWCCIELWHLDTKGLDGISYWKYIRRAREEKK